MDARVVSWSAALLLCSPTCAVLLKIDAYHRRAVGCSTVGLTHLLSDGIKAPVGWHVAAAAAHVRIVSSIEVESGAAARRGRHPSLRPRCIAKFRSDKLYKH